jgi:hypothetical protein
MEREIKFRAWDIINQEMIYPKYDILGFSLSNGDIINRFEVFMQFTGKTDINDKEVYEGDKVVYTLNHDSTQKEIEGVIEWHKYAWRLNRIWLLTEIRKIEVVGNVYEK